MAFNSSHLITSKTVSEMHANMSKLGSVHNAALYPAAGHRGIPRSCCRRMPSAFQISSPPALSPRPVLRNMQHQRLSTVCNTSAYNAGSFNPQRDGRRQLTDVIDDFLNLPWQKIASWAAVALVATQLKDFLGVRISPCFWQYPYSFNSSSDDGKKKENRRRRR